MHCREVHRADLRTATGPTSANSNGVALIACSSSGPPTAADWQVLAAKTYLSSSGLSLPDVQVNAVDSSPSYTLTLSSLSGRLLSPFELKYRVDISGGDVFDSVGLSVSCNAGSTSVTTDRFSDQFFNTIAVQPQTVANTGAATGGMVDGVQSTLWVRVNGTLSGGGDLNAIVNSFDERPSVVPEPSSLVLLGCGVFGALALNLRRNRHQRG